MINGGYILQPRIIQESDISVAPPYVREIWNYLLREANCQDNKYNGHEIKRGQLFRSYDDIKEGTKWFIGWRKMVYNENQVKKAMKFLRDTLRIETMKELGGVMITICKYDYYQTLKNYERTTSEPTERTVEEPMKNQPLPYNNKNKQEGEERKEEKEISSFMSAEEFLELYHRLCPMLNRVKSLSVKRKEKVYSRLKEMKDIETVTRVLTKIGASNFCNGQNEKKWTADFDWVIKNDTIWSRAYEGKYDNKKSDILFNVEKEKPTEFKEF